MEGLGDWLQEYAALFQRFGLWWIALGVASLIVTIVSLPLIVLQLPADYFVEDKRVAIAPSRRHPAVALLLNAFKNAAGIVLVIVGAVMLFVPGQGILTILIGLLLTNFPGKYRLERRLVRRPAVLRTLNRVRRRWRRPPLLHPDGREG